MTDTKKTMMRVQKNKDNPYVLLNKTALNDTSLSWKAKGLHAYLLSLPDDWKIYVEELSKHTSDGRDSTAATIKELIDTGYILRERLHDELGRFKGYEYVVYEMSQITEDIKIKNKELTAIKNKEIADRKKAKAEARKASKINMPTENGNSVNGNSVNGNSVATNNDFKLSNKELNNNQSIIRDIKDDLKKPKKENSKSDGMNDFNSYYSSLDKILKLDDVKTITSQNELVDEIKLNIAEMYISNGITTKDGFKPKAIVRHSLSRLTPDHIITIVNKYLDNSSKTKIKNVKSYLQAMIYNEPYQNDAAIKNEISSDNLDY